MRPWFIALDQVIVPLDYWAWLYSLLATPNFAITTLPTRCSTGNNCESYFLPGAIYNVYPPSSAFLDHPEATLFIVENSIGYQIEFYPLSGTEALNGAECGIYDNVISA